MHKEFRYLLFFLSFGFCSAQNMEILYDFDELPQTLMLNPGSEISYNSHWGIPLLSNLHIEFGASNQNVTYNSIVNGSNGISDILRNIYDQQPASNDIYTITQQLEVFSIGLRLKNPDHYLSFGMYQKMDGFARYPSDLMDLFFNGNDQNGDGIPETSQDFKVSDLNVVGELLSVWHLGLSKTVNENLTVGARFKIYSGGLSLQTKSNEGVYSLENSVSFVHQFQSMNLGINSSGLINNDGSRAWEDPLDVFSNLFFGGGNYGMGMDLGFTYRPGNSIVLTGSIVDLGFVNYSGTVTTYEIKEDFQIVDEPFFPTPGAESTYWSDLWTGYYDDGLLDDVLDTISSSYMQLRPVNVHASFKKILHRGGNSRPAFRNVSCPDNESRGGLESSYGAQLYAEFRPTSTLWAVTGFYSREFSKAIHAKFTYTVDRFSYYNIGIGLSASINRFNLFIAADNLLALPTVRDSNYQSFQLGMNVIIN